MFGAYLVVFTFVAFAVVVLDVEAVVLWGERRSVFGMGDGADGIDRELEVLGVGRGDLQAVEQQAGALGVDPVGSESVDDLDEGSWTDSVSSTAGRWSDPAALPAPAGAPTG